MNQIDLISAICGTLDEAGFSAKPRIISKVIELANECLREPVMASPGMGLRAWLSSDDTGLSSCWMAHVCAGGPGVDPHHARAYPRDPGDFGRCYRFLRAVPEARENMDRLRECSPVWDAYVDAWDAMERLYEEELPSGRGPKLFALMSSIQDSASARVEGESDAAN